MEWNEMIVSFPSLEVFEYRWSSGLSGNLYNRSNIKGMHRLYDLRAGSTKEALCQ